MKILWPLDPGLNLPLSDQGAMGDEYEDIAAEAGYLVAERSRVGESDSLD